IHISVSMLLVEIHGCLAAGLLLRFNIWRTLGESVASLAVSWVLKDKKYSFPSRTQVIRLPRLHAIRKHWHASLIQRIVSHLIWAHSVHHLSGRVTVEAVAWSVECQ